MVIHLPPNPPVARLAKGTPLWRVHRRGRDAVWFGVDRGQPPRGRFAAPDHEFGVCYFAATPEVAVLETVVRSAARLVPRIDLEARAVSRLSSAREMCFLQLEGAGLPPLRIAAERTHGHEYTECQRLALDVFTAHPRIDGIQYRSRWNNSELCWAVFDRASGKIGPVAETSWLGDEKVIGPMLDRFGIGIF